MGEFVIFSKFMQIHIKRIYEKAEKTDGVRILIDRLWPRGVTKEKANVDLWLKDAAPSTELRSWFHADKEHSYKKFSTKYEHELEDNKEAIREAIQKKLSESECRITLLTANKDIECSHVPILADFLKHL